MPRRRLLLSLLRIFRSFFVSCFYDIIIYDLIEISVKSKDNMPYKLVLYPLQELLFPICSILDTHVWQMAACASRIVTCRNLVY